ncbi:MULTISPECIES: hypothetical protein [Mycobacteroides]|uniref:hypothetical protein n=1 Tax=Mycobacteroides TaxID=670516 RepID=UPI00092C894D|nr:hypothetical protein [Mycobacteroides abscessus]NGX06446.1 hypothetical protein [Mycobacteroides franklinii]SHT26202.1 Uncharacterised protein [Mycobacteroides abscessus subsp. abscessus]SHW69585.1 Uncharacterised protein [Mycobacteroides abscessus subsp. abscessus]SHY71682.1 Uncharacterised protein [Mycobacteroides abscessus subsp. abscessus]SHZ43165.1 Uncharacterised protein [Mycobacteroides abscessus subsp. abscessus]
MPDVQKLAALLNSYADYRADYLHVEEPVTACDMERMKFTDLVMWVEVESIRKAARLIADPEDNYIGLPSWRWETWLAEAREALST